MTIYFLFLDLKRVVGPAERTVLVDPSTSLKYPPTRYFWEKTVAKKKMVVPPKVMIETV